MGTRVAGFWTFAEQHPDRCALVEPDGGEVTFGVLGAQVNRVSNALLTRGLADGGVIAVLARNSGSVLAVVLGAFQVGAYVTMVNSHLSPDEVRYILDDSQPAIVFVDERTADLATAALDGTAAPAHLIGLAASFGSAPGLTDWLSTASDGVPTQRSAGTEMLYTSGTSGRPKGVRRPLSNRAPEGDLGRLLITLTRHGIDAAASEGRGVHLVTSPLYHSAPLSKAILALQLGHTVVIMDRFDATRSLELIERHHVTWTQVVPTMMSRWMQLEPDRRKAFDVSSLKWVIHAAAPCPVQLKRDVIEWLGPVVHEYYSATEAGGTVIGPEDALTHPGSVGRPWPRAHVRVLDEHLEDAGPNRIGAIYFKNAVPFEYHKDPEKTAQAVAGNYVTVGDLGHLDEEGYLYLADRRSDLILVGGVNVYPAEVEEALVAHPLVADVAVIGVPDSDLGQRVHAVVSPVPGTDPDALVAELERYSAATIGSQKRPTSFEVRDQVPRNEAGKLLRRQLRDEFAQRVAEPEASR